MIDRHPHLPTATMLQVLDQPCLRHLCAALGRCRVSSRRAAAAVQRSARLSHTMRSNLGARAAVTAGASDTATCRAGTRRHDGAFFWIMLDIHSFRHTGAATSRWPASSRRAAAAARRSLGGRREGLTSHDRARVLASPPRATRATRPTAWPVRAVRLGGSNNQSNLSNRAHRQMSLVASLASLVAAMRARVLDRGACGPLADRRAAAAARREPAGHLLVAAPVWRLSLIHI